MDDFFEFSRNSRNLAISELRSNCIKGFNFSLGLDNVEGVGVGRESNTEAVDGEGAVASLDRNGDVAVVIVVV